MDASSEEESTPLVETSTISTHSHSTSNNIRRTQKTQIGINLILVTILFEVAAYYTYNSNLSVSLSHNQTLNWTSENADKAVIIFDGVYCISIIIFSIISDLKSNRIRMLLIGFPVYLIGYIFSIIIADGDTPICQLKNNTFIHSNSTALIDEQCVYSILPTVIIIALSMGAVRGNMIAFGADQIQNSKFTSNYIDKLIVIFNCAAILETIVNIAIPSDDINLKYYLEFFSVGSTFLFIGGLIFFLGQRYYYHIQSSESVISNYIPVYKYAFRKWLQARKTKNKQLPKENSLNASEFSISDEPTESFVKDYQHRSFLDYADRAHNGIFEDWIVADVKLFQNALIIVILILPYWFVIYNGTRIFSSQYQSMLHGYDHADDLMSIIQWCTVILGILFLNLFGYKYLNKRNFSLTTTKKLIVSMCFGSIGMLMTGGTEIIRQNHCISGLSSLSDLSAYVQVPSRIVMGLSQLFGLLAILEFTCFIAPRSARSIFFSLYFVSRTIANYSVQLMCSNKETRWFYYAWCFILAGFQLIYILILFFCQKKIRLVNINRQLRHR